MLAVQATPPAHVPECVYGHAHSEEPTLGEVWTAEIASLALPPPVGLAASCFAVARRAGTGRQAARPARALAAASGTAPRGARRRRLETRKAKLDTARVCTVTLPGSGGDDVAQDDAVAGHDGDHEADGSVLGGVADAAVFGDGCAGLDAESVGLVRCGHARDDLVDVVGLLVAGFLEDVLAGGVLGCGKLGALDQPKIEVVVGDDRWGAVDVADVSADDARVGGGVEVEQRGDVGGGRDPLDVQ